MNFKEFWTGNKRIVGKLMLNQFGGTFFGLMLFMAASAATAHRAWLMLIASCCAAIFYLYLQYTIIWERGGQDRIRVDSGRAHRKPLTGLYIGLLANIPNFLLAFAVLVSQPFRDTMMWAGTVNGIARVICLLWEGMYAGFVTYFAPNNPLIHLLYVFPSVCIVALGYLLGLSNCRLLSVFDSKKTAKQTTKQK